MNLPMTMQGRLDKCLLLALSVPIKDMPKGIVPNGFRLQTHDGLAFWNVVICHVDKMRPLGVPNLLGMSYHHVGYRLYVETDTDQGLMQGLYFTHSQADSRIICTGGNLASDFRFHFDNIEITQRDSIVTATCDRFEGVTTNAFTVRATMINEPPRAIGNTFSSQDNALKFLKYRPLGLSTGENNQVRIARVIRNEADWREYHLDVTHLEISYFKTLDMPHCKLELATWVEPINYRWKLGETAQIL